MIATKDVPTTFGHPRLHDFRPAEDATLRRLLDEAGAILVGKVYSQIGRGDSIVDCCNPWDVTRSPGTSSSGSGSAVAAGLGLLSIGTDTGGSVRHPASSCNLVGIRATFGRISRHGVLAPSWTHDQAGPLTRTVEDNALVMETLGRFDPLDPVSVERPAEKFTESLAEGVKGLRIGVPTDRWLWEREIEEVEDLVRAAIGVLEELGASVREVSLPLAAENRAVHFKLSQPESYVYWTNNFSREILEGWGRDSARHRVGEASTLCGVHGGSAGSRPHPAGGGRGAAGRGRDSNAHRQHPRRQVRRQDGSYSGTGGAGSVEGGLHKRHRQPDGDACHFGALRLRLGR